MNFLDFNFLFYGPLSTWVLATALFVNAFIFYMFLRLMNKFLPIIPILKDLVPILKNIVPELDKVIKALRSDTVSLNLATSKLDGELKKTKDATIQLNETVGEWLGTIKRMFPWLRLWGNNNN